MFGLTSVEMKLLFKAALALILFNSSVIAEIVRGGLNGVAKGQFEAGYAQGFNTAEVLLYIILPQAYRNIVPTLLSQVITTIKDSSYLANVATIELMARIRQLLSAAGTYNGLGTVNVSDVMVLFGAGFLPRSGGFFVSGRQRFLKTLPNCKKSYNFLIKKGGFPLTALL